MNALPMLRFAANEELCGFYVLQISCKASLDIKVSCFVFDITIRQKALFIT